MGKNTIVISVIEHKRAILAATALCIYLESQFTEGFREHARTYAPKNKSAISLIANTNHNESNIRIKNNVFFSVNLSLKSIEKAPIMNNAIIIQNLYK